MASNLYCYKAALSHAVNSAMCLHVVQRNLVANASICFKTGTELCMSWPMRCTAVAYWLACMHPINASQHTMSMFNR